MKIYYSLHELQNIMANLSKYYLSDGKVLAFAIIYGSCSTPAAEYALPGVCQFFGLLASCRGC